MISPDFVILQQLVDLGITRKFDTYKMLREVANRIKVRG